MLLSYDSFHIDVTIQRVWFIPSRCYNSTSVIHSSLLLQVQWPDSFANVATIQNRWFIQGSWYNFQIADSFRQLLIQVNDYVLVWFILWYCYISLRMIHSFSLLHFLRIWFILECCYNSPRLIHLNSYWYKSTTTFSFDSFCDIVTFH